MNQPIDYLGALQSIFDFVTEYNQRLDSKLKIIQVEWDFCLDKASRTRKAGELNLATGATLKDDLVQIAFSVNAHNSKSDYGTPIPAFTIALENALQPFLQVIDSSCSSGDGTTLTSSEVELVFTLDDQNRIQFSGVAQDDNSGVTHKLKFTIQALTSGRFKHLHLDDSSTYIWTI